MVHCGTLIRRFAADTDGATAIEYAMIAAGVGVAVAGTVWVLGAEVKAMFDKVAGLF